MAMTARTVAQRAGVSVSTVSRAFADPPQASAETRAKVLRVAKELGYRPNGAARSLVTGRTTSIGLVVPDLENPYFASFAKGVQARAWSSGYSVLIADSDEDPASEARLVPSLAARVDGMILCSPRSDAAVDARHTTTATVVVNRKVPTTAWLTVDNAGATHLAVSHLRALGHRTIAYAGGPRSSWSDEERRVGLARCTEEFPDTTIVDLGHFGPYYSGGRAAADLAVASAATAVIGFNDLVALGLIVRLRERGIDVPDEMSVVGIDNASVSTLASPQLTTVGVPQAQLGRTAVDMLLGLIERPGRRPFPTETFPVELVLRQSTAEPRSSGRPTGSSAALHQ